MLAETAVGGAVGLGFIVVVDEAELVVEDGALVPFVAVVVVGAVMPFVVDTEVPALAAANCALSQTKP